MKGWQWLWIAFLGLTATVLGALAAHGATDLSLAQQASLATAVRYQQGYALLLLCLMPLEWLTKQQWRWVFGLWSLGIVAFSGSIYMLITTSWHWLWPVTPIGGGLLMLGWVALGITGWHCAKGFNQPA